MEICGNEIKPEWLFEVVAEYYHEKGYSFDEYDKENNLIILQTALPDIIEEKDVFNKLHSCDNTFRASGFLKIPYAIYSRK